MTFDFDRIVSTLSRHGVAYVLIGGIAAVAHGSTLATEDVDLTQPETKRTSTGSAKRSSSSGPEHERRTNRTVSSSRATDASSRRCRPC